MPNTDFTRSTDSATSFEGPYKLPRHPKWGTNDVGPDGELYIVGTNLSGIGHLFLRSDDAKDAAEIPSFPTIDSIELGGDIAVGATPNPGGLLGQDWVAVDRSTGSTRGNVYVLASVDPPGADPLDVHLIRSEDGGQTWSAPLRVNDDPTDNGAYQWFGTMSVSPQGRIDVIWNDTRNDASGTTSEVFYAYSTDAGDTWSAGLPVSPPWNSLIGYPNQNKIGDYYHMISNAEGAGLAYSATFNGEQDVYFLRVGDCNVNGQHDSTDIATQFSGDCNENGIADECEENLACTSCSIDADCDDGVFCNGTELCLAGFCSAGTPVDCDDGVACTQDSCNLAADVCENLTDDALCDNGLFCDGDETCNPTSDCQPGADSCPDPDERCLENDDTCCTVEVEICNDAVDNDCDGSADCLDVDCAGSPACACDNDGNCEAGEDCETCSNDCVSGLQSCGNGVCEPSLGEDCVSCGEDCNGKQNGKPQNRFCCGDGDGTNPLGCSAPVCSSSGFSCSDVFVPSSCCGDGACEVGEDSCSCGIDCGFPGDSESVCDDGVDDDCDGTIDCEDQECAGDPVCAGCVPTSNKEKGPRCTDGVDNDCDGLIDAADPDC
jgi:hypothetical protein